MIVTDWQPVCSIELLRLRAAILAELREFFSMREVLEVETPVLSHHVGTDPNLNFFNCQFEFTSKPSQLYLQTSPEFAMKRLLAAGSGSIFQICKAFRNGELGRYHNPEFTLLEWYRVGFDLEQLMMEIVQLMELLLRDRAMINKIIKISYRDIFFQYTGLDALDFSLSGYRACAENLNLRDAVALCGEEPAKWLDYLFSEVVQTAMQEDCLYLVYNYPACLPSLARHCASEPALVERVELFFAGIELGNGYYELANVEIQEQRFDQETQYREVHGLPTVAKDRRLLAALQSGLPDCSGMAIGLDRLLMLASGQKSIAETLAFPVQWA